MHHSHGINCENECVWIGNRASGVMFRLLDGEPGIGYNTPVL
jgi:hypothetical protein